MVKFTFKLELILFSKLPWPVDCKVQNDLAYGFTSWATQRWKVKDIY